MTHDTAAVTPVEQRLKIFTKSQRNTPSTKFVSATNEFKETGVTFRKRLNSNAILRLLAEAYLFRLQEIL